VSIIKTYFRITVRNKEDGEQKEYLIANFSNWRKQHGIRDDKFRRGMELNYGKFYVPREGLHDYKKETFDISEEEYLQLSFDDENGSVVKKQNRIEIKETGEKCDHCGEGSKYLFRDTKLCQACYDDPNILKDILDATFGRKTNLDSIIALEKRNVLVIPDLHAPFILDGYLDFCKYLQAKYECNVVVFLGDIIDNHYSSYHEADPDGMCAGRELQKAKDQIGDFYRAFPEALVTVGNHDAMSNRKAMSAGLSSRWVKTLDEVLDVPNWTFDEKFIIDNIRYSHGLGGDALSQMNKSMISNVCGHYHMKTFLNYKTGENNHRTFAMQLGVGCDKNKYAFAYGRHFGEMQVNAGVILDNGRRPIIECFDDWKFDNEQI